MRVLYRCNKKADFPSMEMSKQSFKKWVTWSFPYNVAESPYYSMPFMLADLAIIADCLMVGSDRDVMMFVDTDVIVRDALEIEGITDDQEHWDFCVTWRDNMGDLGKLQPYNFGVWWARRTSASIWAATWMFRRCLQLMPDSQNWYGNQVAMRELLGPPVKDGSIKHVKLDCGLTLKVKMLPGDIYNYTPEKIGEDVSQKKILHFKGNRKEMMGHYLKEALREQDQQPA